MKCILATKQYMTQLFDEEGLVHPATVLQAGPITITALREPEKDGYEAVQVGFGARREKNVHKAQRLQGLFSAIREFRGKGDHAVGHTIDVSVFAKGDSVSVSGVTKGKGFQGVVKRHNFAGDKRSHGRKHSERKPGSIGATGPQRVFKGKKMAGRMGGKRVTVKNLTVLAVDPQQHVLVLQGAIPGRRGSLVEIRG